MKTKFFSSAFLLAVLVMSLSSYALSDQQAAALATQFAPPPVTYWLTPPHDDSGIAKAMQNPLQQIQWDESLQYLAFTMPGDGNQYVLLAWSLSDGGVYWRLIRSPDQGATYAVAQDAPGWYDGFHFSRHPSWSLRLQDLTNDGVPEILLEGSDMLLAVFAWRGGQLLLITPADESGRFGGGCEGLPCVAIATALETSEGLSIEDIDGDGIAEIIVPPFFTRVLQDDGGTIGVPSTPTRIYKYDGTSYVLWKEYPYSPNDPFPIHVPGIAVLHPGTLALSELSSPGKGDLQVFISHPAGTNTVDDIDAASLAFQGAPLSFKKRWPNRKQPDTTSANWEWEGCPVKQTAAKGQGEWNPSPEDPYLPSPDGKTEYHFVAPYLEFRLPRSAVFPYLLQQAQAAFAKEPGRQTYFIEIPISGKMKNGKLAAVSALACIKNTGNPAKAATQPPAPSPGVAK